MFLLNFYLAPRKVRIGNEIGFRLAKLVGLARASLKAGAAVLETANLPVVAFEVLVGHSGPVCGLSCRRERKPAVCFAIRQLLVLIQGVNS